MNKNDELKNIDLTIENFDSDEYLIGNNISNKKDGNDDNKFDKLSKRNIISIPIFKSDKVDNPNNIKNNNKKNNINLKKSVLNDGINLKINSDQIKNNKTKIKNYKKDIFDKVQKSSNEQEKIQNNSNDLDLKKIVDLFSCTLCIGIFRNPYRIKECMDVFCRSCIVKYFINNPNCKECPLCHTSIPGKPIDDLIAESDIPHLISVIFPEFEILDNFQEREFYEFFESEGGLLDKNKLEQKINVHLLPIKTDDSRYVLPAISDYNIKVESDIKVLSLKAYLLNFLKLNENEDLQMYYNNQCVNDHEILSCIFKKYKSRDLQKAIFHYSKKIIDEEIKDESDDNEVVKMDIY